MKILEFAPGKNFLTEVMSKFKIPHRVQHHHGSEVCLRSSRHDDSTILRFSGSFLFGDDQITSIQLNKSAKEARGPRAEFDEAECTPTDRVDRWTKFRSGLHLGMTRSSVEAVLGEPTETTQNQYRYSTRQETKVKNNDTQEGSAVLVEDRIVTVQFSGNAATQITEQFWQEIDTRPRSTLQELPRRP